MSGFAIWFEGENINNSLKCDYDVHINLWTNYKSPILDIGIKTKYMSQLKSIKIFIPFKCSDKYKIDDLGSTITKTKNMLDAVFNESYNMISANIPKQTRVSDENGELQFIVYELDKNKDISVVKGYGGSVLTINLADKKGLSENTEYYFRLRYEDRSLNKLIESRKDYNILNALLTENNFIDFRLNDWRSLSDPSLIEHIQDYKINEYCLSKANFFVMALGQLDIISRTKKSERKLENNIWNEYIDIDNKNVIIAHQWQVKKEFKEKNGEMEIKYPSSFNAYFKLKKQWINFKTIIGYLIIILIINLLSSTLFQLFLICFGR